MISAAPERRCREHCITFANRTRACGRRDFRNVPAPPCQRRPDPGHPSTAIPRRRPLSFHLGVRFGHLFSSERRTRMNLGAWLGIGIVGGAITLFAVAPLPLATHGERDDAEGAPPISDAVEPGWSGRRHDPRESPHFQRCRPPVTIRGCPRRAHDSDASGRTRRLRPQRGRQHHSVPESPGRRPHPSSVIPRSERRFAVLSTIHSIMKEIEHAPR